MMAVSAGTIVLMTVGIVALEVGMGAIFPRFHVENLTQIATGFGGIVYMIVCMAFIGAIVLLEASPVYLLFMEEIGMGAISPLEWVWIWGSFALVVVIGVLAVVLPMRIGHRKMVELEL
jgi:ABC-2 type transport system permease protein